MLQQVGLYCPKVAIMMEGWATESKPAQFEVAAQELSAKYHYGIQCVGHSQTGQGSMSLQVLLAAQGLHAYCHGATAMLCQLHRFTAA